MLGNGQPKIALGDESLYYQYHEIDPFDVILSSGARRTPPEGIHGIYPRVLITIYDTNKS
jgi:hypothetical protein